MTCPYLLTLQRLNWTTTVIIVAIFYVMLIICLVLLKCVGQVSPHLIIFLEYKTVTNINCHFIYE